MNGKRILVADDEAHMTRVIEFFLRREGCAVEVVHNGQEALKSILRDPPDALVTDVNMPRMSGKELCLQLEQQLPGRKFRIYVMTANTDREHRDWSSKVHDCFFMEKPVSMRVLVSMLAKNFEDERQSAAGSARSSV